MIESDINIPDEFAEWNTARRAYCNGYARGVEDTLAEVKQPTLWGEIGRAALFAFVFFIVLILCGAAFSSCSASEAPAEIIDLDGRADRDAHDAGARSGDQSTIQLERISATEKVGFKTRKSISEESVQFRPVREYLCDDQEVSGMPGGRIPPLVAQGKTCVCQQYPPGVADGIVWAWQKAKPIAAAAGKAVNAAKRQVVAKLKEFVVHKSGRTYFEQLLAGK